MIWKLLEAFKTIKSLPFGLSSVIIQMEFSVLHPSVSGNAFILETSGVMVLFYCISKVHRI